MSAAPLPLSVPPRTAKARRGVPGRGWGGRLARVGRALTRHHTSIMAAGIAYYAMLSIFPGMTALVLTYGLVADPQIIARHTGALAGVLPREALELLTSQLNALASAPTGKLGFGLIVSALIALWTATSGTSAMMSALTVAYEGQEGRSLVHFYALSLALTVGGAVFVLIALVLIAGVPATVDRLPLPPLWQQLLPSIRFPMLAVLAFLGLAALYRLAPDRRRPAWDFLRPGTILASLLWLAGSAAFSFYAAHFGSYDRTYGSLGAVAILLVWLYVSAYIVLAGAELNGESLRARGRERPGS